MMHTLGLAGHRVHAACTCNSSLPCSSPIIHFRLPAPAPKYGSVWEQLADICNTLLGTLGLSEAVTDNASVNVVPLQARRGRWK